MAKSLNKVILIGNLGNDPEVRTTNNGSKVATLSLATGRQWKGADGSPQEKTEWHRVVCWNSRSGSGLADVVERYAKKGDRLYVEGEIEYRSYQDKDNQTRYSTEIRARDIILLGGRGDGETRTSSAGAAGTAARKPVPFDDLPDALDADDDDLPF